MELQSADAPPPPPAGSASAAVASAAESEPEFMDMSYLAAVTAEDPSDPDPSSAMDVTQIFLSDRFDGETLADAVARVQRPPPPPRTPPPPHTSAAGSGRRVRFGPGQISAAGSGPTGSVVADGIQATLADGGVRIEFTNQGRRSLALQMPAQDAGRLAQILTELLRRGSAGEMS